MTRGNPGSSDTSTRASRRSALARINGRIARTTSFTCTFKAGRKYRLSWRGKSVSSSNSAYAFSEGAGNPRTDFANGGLAILGVLLLQCVHGDLLGQHLRGQELVPSVHMDSCVVVTWTGMEVDRSAAG
jgi:hypothetical protein